MKAYTGYSLRHVRGSWVASFCEDPVHVGVCRLHRTQNDTRSNRFHRSESSQKYEKKKKYITLR
jgi:hypothetical protein